MNGELCGCGGERDGLREREKVYSADNEDRTLFSVGEQVPERKWGGWVRMGRERGYRCLIH